jgi:nicotinamidase-related amidase
MTEPEESKVAVVLIDVINGFNFEGSEGLAAAARRAAPKILLLRERAHEANVPVIYVNDGFGHSQDDFAAVVSACSAHDQPGHDVARMLVPTEQDHVLLKVGSSAFDGADLDSLLRRLGVQRLVLSGFATNDSLLATATDAHSRGYEVLVPGDCTAANSPQLAAQALERMHVAASARTDDSLQIDLAALGY